MNYAIDQMMRAVEDSDATIDTLRDELAAAERDRDAQRTRAEDAERERDALRATLARVVAAVRHERDVRAAWLATLPPCATAPAAVLAAEAATGAALAGEGR